ncbi:MAG: hypothetical protein V3V20_08355, partial [Algisphaera sp.]
MHLVDQSGPGAAPTVLAHLAQRVSAGDHVLLLGSTPLHHAANAAGLTGPHVQRHPARRGDARGAYHAIKRAVDHLDATRVIGTTPQFAAWSVSAARVLQRLVDPRRIALHLITDDLLHTPQGQRALQKLNNGGITLRPFGNALASACIAAHWPIARVEAQPLPNPPAPIADPHFTRSALRARWNISPDTPVVALLSDPATAANTFTASLVLSLIRSASDQRVRLLVHPQQHHRTRTQDHLDRGPDADMLLQDADLALPHRVLPGCDAVLLTCAPAPLSARYAVAAGLPPPAPPPPPPPEP